MYRKAERGTSTVEMAAILPVLILLVLGATDLGRLFYDAIAVSNAVRAGLSYGSLDDARSKDSTKISQIASLDTSYVEGITVTSERICECADESVVDCDTGTCSEGEPRAYVKVEATKTYSTMLPYPGIPSSVTVSRKAYMRAR